MATNPVLPIDESHDDDMDSSLGYSINSETTTLGSSILRYREENGRRYHAYKDGSYWGPNDEKQNNYADIFHHVMTMTLDDVLFKAPIKNPKRVLDIGTGTGIWAIDFADQFPSAEVIGNDLSPIQPSFVPPNVKFEVDDITLDWSYEKESFDFIHTRCLFGSVADWPALYKQIYDHLEPGAYFEQIEGSVVPGSDDGSITKGSPLDIWGEVNVAAGEKFGKTMMIYKDMKKLMGEAGFVDLEEMRWKWPVGAWSSDPKFKEIGRWNRLLWEEGMEGWILALWTRVMGWTYEEVQVFLGKVRAELKNKKIHSWHEVRLVYGRKPLKEPTAA